MATPSPPASKYVLNLEVEGRLGMFADPSTGTNRESYPCPTYSATKGIFESVFFMPTVEVVPLWVEICSPTIWMPYFYKSNSSPLRKNNQIKSNNAQIIRESVLCDPCFKLCAVAVDNPDVEPSEEYAEINQAHSYQEQFLRHLRHGWRRRHPALGRSEFLCSYWGPLRPETRPVREENHEIPSMLWSIHSEPVRGEEVRPKFALDVEIREGVLDYWGFETVEAS